MENKMNTNPLTSVAIDTSFGIKEIKLYNNDITKLNFDIDVLFVSAFEGDYSVDNNSLISQLYENLKCNVSVLSKKPEIDLKNDLFVWMSKKINNQKMKRIGCIEIIGNINSIKRLKICLKNLFFMLAIADYNQIEIQSIALPIIGSGEQELDPELLVPILIEYSKESLEKIKGLREINYIEIDAEKSVIIKNYIDKYLKREYTEHNFNVLTSKNIDTQILKTLQRKCEFLQLELYDESEVANKNLDEVIMNLKANRISLTFLSSCFRTLLEAFIKSYVNDYKRLGLKPEAKYGKLPPPIESILKDDLANQLSKIKREYNNHRISAITFSRFFELREFGNSLVHDSGNKNIPETIHKESILIYLYSCINFLDFWILYRAHILSME